MQISTLWHAPKHAAVAIDTIADSVTPMVLQRLFDMGLEPGQTVLSLGRGPFNGPLVVQINDCVFSIEQQVAQHIFVSTHR